MRIIYMGTPDFAVPALEALIQSEHEVVAVVSQEDKPKGRGKTLQPTAVKVKALEYNIPVFQPHRIRNKESLAYLESLKPDVIVVAAYGQILPERLLDLPEYGCICIHASLLPKYRGAAPIQWAVIDGEIKTGLTTMLMDKGIDTGDMLEKVEVEIGRKENAGELQERLSHFGGPLILSTLKHLEEGTAKRISQNDEESNYAVILTKEMGRIDFTQPAKAIECKIRGLNPWPAAYTAYEDSIWKIWDADVIETADVSAYQPGEIIEVSKKGILVAAGQGVLQIKELQMQGKKRMTVEAFVCGYPVKEHVVLQ